MVDSVAPVTEQTAVPRVVVADAPSPKPVRRKKPTREPKPKATIRLHYVGDGTIFQSGVPNRDITDEDGPVFETQIDSNGKKSALADLAVATGTHVRT